MHIVVCFSEIKKILNVSHAYWLTRNLVQYVNRMLVGALINSLVHYSLSYSLIDVLYYYDYDKSVSVGLVL